LAPWFQRSTLARAWLAFLHCDTRAKCKSCGEMSAASSSVTCPGVFHRPVGNARGDTQGSNRLGSSSITTITQPPEAQATRHTARIDRDEDDDNDDTCPLFLVPGDLPSNFGTSSTLRVCGALTEASMCITDDEGEGPSDRDTTTDIDEDAPLSSHDEASDNEAARWATMPRSTRSSQAHR
jgi:hypothetical protein